MGRHITEKFGDHKAVYEVVGVARNLRDHNLKGDVPPRFYVSGEQGLEGPNDSATFEIRTAGEPTQMFEAIRKTILSVNQDLQLDPFRTLTENLDRNTAQPRMMARLCTLFGLVALLLAATGLYGVLSYAVTRRTNEIGVRMALGAGRGQVVNMILRETGVMILIGALVGVAGSAGLAKLIQSRLFGLSTLDPLTIASALAILAFVALIAGYIPAMRAARVNPVRALRHE
jgi:ABC-type antimicrobial peptide transport system permease subunit